MFKLCIVTAAVIGHIVSTVIKKAFSKHSQGPHIQIYGWTGLNCHYKTAVQLQDLPWTATHQH